MSGAETPIRAILDANVGFRTPDLWLDYAARHAFERVAAARVPLCPDRGEPPLRRLGQYVYYSTLIHLKECGVCGLIWADARIDPEVTRRHFERAYKDDEYFAARRAIYRHLARIVDRRAPPGGRVVDLGGAVGHLMALLAASRPDLKIVVCDVSSRAATIARERFGLETVCGGFETLARGASRFDVVVLSDVLYYEPRLPFFWSALPRILEEDGAVVLRVPNKLPAIRAAQAARRAFSSRPRLLRQDRIPFFNPEHIFVFSRRYLAARLRGLGFETVRVHPSPPLGGGRARDAAARVLYLVARCAAGATGGLLAPTPGIVIEAARAPRAKKAERRLSGGPSS